MDDARNNSILRIVGLRLAKNTRAALFWAFIITALIFSAMQPARNAQLHIHRIESSVGELLIKRSQYQTRGIGQNETAEVDNLSPTQSASRIYSDDEYKTEVARLIKMQSLGLPLVSEKFPELARTLTEEEHKADPADKARNLYASVDFTRQPSFRQNVLTPSEEGMILAAVTAVFVFPSLSLLLLLVFSVMPQYAANQSRMSLFYRRLSLSSELVDLAKITGAVVAVGAILRLVLLLSELAASGGELSPSTTVLVIAAMAMLILGIITSVKEIYNYAAALAILSIFVLCSDLYIKMIGGQNAGVMLLSIISAYLCTRYSYLRSSHKQNGLY